MLKDKIFRLLRQYCDVNSPQEFIEINTVDAFQGREKEIIIFSCVRSSAKGNLGFVSDYRRMNVAITRARHCLYVVGNSSTLTRDVNWRGFINFCKNKGTNYYSEMKNKTQAISKTPVGSKENRPTNFSDAT
jgi:senataxin